MAQQTYPPAQIIGNIIDKFFNYRGYALMPRGNVGTAPVFTMDSIIHDMTQFEYVRIDAQNSKPRNSRNWVIILVLKYDGKYSEHAPKLRDLLESIESEKLSKDNLIDEVIIIVDPEFFTKKSLMEEIAKRTTLATDPNADNKPFFNVFPYRNFVIEIPLHVGVPKHTILTDKEATDLLANEYLNRSDLPVIFHNDPPVVWIGGREGQIVSIRSDSETAGESIRYRRIERGAA
jgi:DNA-directed RNA polymerase subunit H (RpoH/RPB5)